MQVTINLPATLDVTSREQSVTLDVTKLPVAIIERAIAHGLTQKIADAAAGAKRVAEESDDMTVEEATVSLMQAVVDTLEGGSWGRERGAASGLSARDAMARKIVGDWFRSTYAKGTPERDKYNDADSAGRYAIIDKIWADNADAFGPAVDDAIAAEKAKKAGLAKIAVSIS